MAKKKVIAKGTSIDGRTEYLLEWKSKDGKTTINEWVSARDLLPKGYTTKIKLPPKK